MSLMDLLLRLRRRLELTDNSRDALLCDLLADANALMLAYMGRDTLPDALLGTQCQLAAMLYNRLGMEGESQRSEGGVSMTVDTLPEDILVQLRPWRLCKAVRL